MAKVPRRRRFKHQKRHKNQQSRKGKCDPKNSSRNLDLMNEEHEREREHSFSVDANDCAQALIQIESNAEEKFECISKEASSPQMGIDCCSPNPVQSVNFHDYARPPSDLEMSDAVKDVTIDLELWVDVKRKLELFMNHRWIPILHHNCIHVVLISSQNNLSIQRSLVFSANGDVELYVHCHPMEIHKFVKDVSDPVILSNESLDSFVDRCVEIVNRINCFEICGGFDDEKYKVSWASCDFGEKDSNPYRECRYTETFRSFLCTRLVNKQKWRCNDCTKLYGPLKRRTNAINQEARSIKTANKYLSEDQKLNKLQQQRRDIVIANKKIARLQKRMQELIQEEGVQIDDMLSSDLTDILKNSKITPAQSIFLQQQVKASQRDNMAGMRWHPTLLRLAISLYTTSASAYELLRDTGMVKLPSSRTLFDYSHVKPVEEGIDKVTLESISDKVDKFTKAHQKFHVLMADEMSISQNLVFQKSSGRLVGYTSLDKVDEEVRTLEKYLDNPDEEVQEVVATKVLTYMIKGVSNGMKGVVATYAVGNLSVDQLYLWTWQVIGALERSGIAVVVFVSDGCSVNRAFIKKHKPKTILESGVVFDTVNKVAPRRTLYFMSDVPHLLKTIRNCFANSRSDKKKGRRSLIRHGKKISWDYIIRLFKSKKGKSLRKAFKLTAMNVFPDSYARMKVKYAAEILSRTVAQALEDEKWEGAAETIFFIRFVNDWFDCLNGAHSSIGNKKRNEFLKPYTKDCTTGTDGRFDFLREFLKYLRDWQEEAENPNCTLNNSAAGDISVAPNEDSFSSLTEEVSCNEEETPASKRILSKQTLEGIEMSTLAFIDVVSFLVTEGGVDFINARVFTQDPLEQHFSRVRAGQGGSNNPNLGQVLNRNRAIHTMGELGMKKRKGNSGEFSSAVEVTTDPLPKRKSTRTPKISSQHLT